MDIAAVVVMAAVMIGAALWCWRLENLPNAEQKVKRPEDREEK